MSKQKILSDMLIKYDAYIRDWHCPLKWEAYKSAWRSWRAVKGDE